MNKKVSFWILTYPNDARVIFVGKYKVTYVNPTMLREWLNIEGSVPIALLKYEDYNEYM